MRRKPSSLALALTVLAVLGCASTESRGPYPEPRPLGRELTVHWAERSDEKPEFLEPEGVLALPVALAAALAANPRLASFSWEVRALDAEALQAGLFPNPELEGEFEEFGGTGGRRGLDDAEATLRVAQLFELGGKRGKRRAVAELTRDLGGWDYESARLDVFTETTRDFVAMVAAQTRVSLAEEAHRLAQKTFGVVSERVEAGKVSPLERDRTQVLLSSRRIALDRVRRELEIARQSLAANWGAASPQFDRAEGEFTEVLPVPGLTDLLPHLERNPDVARWPTELDLRRAQLELAETGAIPDVTGQVGVQRFAGPNETAFVLGVGIDLPVFDRNQGGIRAARRRIAKAAEERRAAETAARTGLKVAHEELSGAWLAATSLREEVLPAAERTFQGVQEAYPAKAGYLAVLDAQAALVEARFQYLDVLESYYRARAKVERLIAGPLNGDGGGDGDDR